jgi:hypothetical protein
MREISTEENIKCDCCNKPLSKPLYYSNDGSYQENFITFKGYDVCFICTARLFEDYAEELNINEKDIKGRYLSLAEREKEKINDSLSSFFKFSLGFVK